MCMWKMDFTKGTHSTRRIITSKSTFSKFPHAWFGNHLTHSVHNHSNALVAFETCLASVQALHWWQWVVFLTGIGDLLNAETTAQRIQALRHVSAEATALYCRQKCSHVGRVSSLWHCVCVCNVFSGLWTVVNGALYNENRHPHAPWSKTYQACTICIVQATMGWPIRAPRFGNRRPVNRHVAGNWQCTGEGHLLTMFPFGFIDLRV